MNRIRRLSNKKEQHYRDAFGTHHFHAAGNISLITTIPQGTGVTERVGKKIKLKSMGLHGAAFTNVTATINNCALLVVYDKRPDGALPAVIEILDFANSRVFANNDNEDRFVVLKRQDWVRSGNTIALNYKIQNNIDWELNLKDIPMVFKSLGTGAIDDIEQGALYLVTVGNQIAGTDAAQIISEVRVRFEDV